MTRTHQLTERIDSLNDYLTEGKRLHDDRDAAEAEFRQLRDELASWQRKLYAQGKHRVLILFQAMDAGGKDGTIRKVFRGVNPQGVRVHSFKKPTPIELAHDFLWRVHPVVPADGMISVFNRSHYEDVLVVRVDNLAPEEVWRARYGQINQFERLLAESGTTILKFYLHISPEEQRERFQARIDDPEKHWKFSFEDLEKRKQWSDYMKAYRDALNECNMPWAPWYIIPSDQKWYRNLAVARIIVSHMRQLAPAFPESGAEIGDVVVQ